MDKKPYYFAVTRSDEDILAWIVEISYWNKKGHCDDQESGDSLNLRGKHWGIAMESCLEWYPNDSIEEAHQDLIDNGLQFNKEFADYIAECNDNNGDIVYYG